MKSQYKLYEMTDPYVAVFCQPKTALNTSQPLSVSGLQQLTCHTVFVTSYEPIPFPASATSLPHLGGEGMVLQTPDCLGEHAGSDQVKHACGDNQEDLDGHLIATTVDAQTNNKACDYASDDGDRE